MIQQLTANGASGVNGRNATRLAVLGRKARWEHMPSLPSLVEKSVKETQMCQHSVTLLTNWNKPLLNKPQKLPNWRDIIMVRPNHDIHGEKWQNQRWKHDLSLRIADCAFVHTKHINGSFFHNINLLVLLWKCSNWLLCVWNKALMYIWSKTSFLLDKAVLQ